MTGDSNIFYTYNSQKYETVLKQHQNTLSKVKIHRHNVHNQSTDIGVFTGTKNNK